MSFGIADIRIAGGSILRPLLIFCFIVIMITAVGCAPHVAEPMAICVGKATVEEAITGDEKGIGPLAHEARINRIDLANSAGVEDMDL